MTRPSKDYMVMMSKADAALSKKTVASYESALLFLGQAAKLDIEEFQEEQIKKKAEYAKTTLKELKQKEAAAKEAAQKAKTAKKAAQPKEKAGDKQSPTKHQAPEVKNGD